MPKSITVKELNAKLVAGLIDARIIDVRSPEEFSSGAIPQAMNIPLSQLASRVTELKATKTLYVVCHSGGRSRVAALMLKAAGCTSVYNVTGGTSAWLAAGFSS